MCVEVCVCWDCVRWIVCWSACVQVYVYVSVFFSLHAHVPSPSTCTHTITTITTTTNITNTILHSDVRPMSAEDKEDIKAYGWDQEQAHGELGIRQPWGEPGFAPLEHTYGGHMEDIWMLFSVFLLGIHLPTHMTILLPTDTCPSTSPHTHVHPPHTHVHHLPPRHITPPGGIAPHWMWWVLCQVTLGMASKPYSLRSPLPRSHHGSCPTWTLRQHYSSSGRT